MGDTVQNCNDYSKEYIENLFKKKNKQDVYNKYKETYPLPLEELVEELGIKVEYKFSDDGIAGFYDGNKTIYINKGHPPVRQRFSLSHELGHYLMDHGSSFRQSLVVYDAEEKRKERNANLFARSILMPIDEIDKFLQTFKDKIEKGEIPFTQSLVKKFGVSIDALKVRLMTLGFIEGW